MRPQARRHRLAQASQTNVLVWRRVLLANMRGWIDQGSLGMPVSVAQSWLRSWRLSERDVQRVLAGTWWIQVKEDDGERYLGPAMKMDPSGPDALGDTD